MKGFKAFCRAGWKLAFGALLLAWIFQAIFLGEGKAAAARKHPAARLLPQRRARAGLRGDVLFARQVLHAHQVRVVL